MTPKEKAEELVDRFREYSHTDFNDSRGGYQIDTQIRNAKQCALIAVDEILIAMPEASDYDSRYNHELVYWQLVKEEIQKL